MPSSNPIDLPPWAQVSDKRIGHIARVTALLGAWAAAMRLPRDRALLFLDAGRLHDALRDAPVDQLRDITGEQHSPEGLLWHGPAAAEFSWSAVERTSSRLSPRHAISLSHGWLSELGAGRSGAVHGRLPGAWTEILAARSALSHHARTDGVRRGLPPDRAAAPRMVHTGRELHLSRNDRAVE